MSDAPPPGGYPQEPQQPPGGYQPPQPPPAPSYQPPTYQPPPAQPAQPMYQQPAQFQPVNPGASSSGNGCLKAFLIIGGISAILGVIIVVFVVFVIGSAVNEVANDPSFQFGTANSAHYDVQIDTCTVDDFGFVEATGTITNKDTNRHAFTVNVDFTDPGNANLKLGGSSDITSGLNEGQSEAWSITSTATGEPGEVECKVSEVSYFGT